MLFDRTLPPLTGIMAILYWVCIICAAISLFLPCFLTALDHFKEKNKCKCVILGIVGALIFVVLAYIILRIHSTNIKNMTEMWCVVGCYLKTF